MFRLLLSNKFVKMCAGRSVSSLSVRSDVCKILDTHLKIDDNGMKKINKLKADTIIAKIPKNQIIQNCTIMQNMGINLEKVQFLAHCLMLQPMVMRNRIAILKEMGVKSVGLDHIFRFPSSMRKSLKGFKRRHGIPEKQSITDNVFTNLGIAISDNNIVSVEVKHNVKTGDHYQLCMLYYKVVHLKLHGQLCNKNRKLKYRSLSETSKLVNILKTECDFDEKFIKRYPQLLNLDVDNVMEFLSEFKDVEVSGSTIIDLVKRNPHMLFYDTGKVRELLRIQKALGMPEHALRSCPRVLGMDKGRFLERYMNIANTYELCLWLQHPRVSNMIYRYNLVATRIDFLKPLNCINNANIQTYLSARKCFLRFVEGDMERTAIKKYFKYVLHKELGENSVSLMYYIQKHPYWKHVPLLHIERMLRYLKKHFSVEDISQNIHIILYPRSKVVQVLNAVREEYSAEAGYDFTPKQYLALCLYKLEKKYHFTGDAVWQTVHTEMSDFSPNLFEDVEKNKSDNLVEYINAHDNEILNVSGAAWLEYLLR